AIAFGPLEAPIGRRGPTSPIRPMGHHLPESEHAPGHPDRRKISMTGPCPLFTLMYVDPPTGEPAMHKRCVWTFPTLLLLALRLNPAQSAEPTPEGIEFFEKKVRPVLVENCQRCHGDAKQKGGLRLDSRAGLLKGGDTGPAIVPGKAEASLLVKAVHYQ